MEYEYRYLSEEKVAEIDAKGFVDNLGRKIHINCGESVTNKDETIVFQQTWHSHDEDEPDEYFLKYKNGYYFINMFIKSIKDENRGENKDWYYIFDIESIYNTENKEEYPDKEFVEVVKNLYLQDYAMERKSEKSEIKLLLK